MSAISLASAFLIPTVAGFLFVSWLLKDDCETGVFERIFLGYGLGLGFLSYVMFIQGLVGIDYVLSNVIVFEGVFILAVVALLAYSKMPLARIFATCLAGFPHDGKRWRYIVYAGLIVWILSKISFVLYEGLSRPVFSWDAWVIWSSGAKFFYYEKGLLLDPSNEFFFGANYRGILGYPLLLPLVEVWTSFFSGGFHEIYSKASVPFYFMALVGVFFFTLKRETGWMPALAGTAFLSSVPILTYHATDAYADIVLAYYGFCGVICFLRYMGRGSKNLLSLCGILLGMGIFAKNEGLFFAAATAASLGLFIFFEKKGNIADVFWFIIPLAIISGPWLLFKMIYGLSYGQGIPQGFVGAALTVEGIKEYLEVVTLEASLNMIIPFLFIIIVLRPRILLEQDARYLFMIIISVAAMFFFAYIMSRALYDQALIGRTAVNRNILTWIALAYFLAGIVSFRLLYREVREPAGGPVRRAGRAGRMGRGAKGRR